MKVIVKNARIVNPLSETYGSIEIENGIVRAVGQVDDSDAGEMGIDAEGRLALPGFIDVHIQGAGGSDVLDAEADALNRISRVCTRFGVTGFLATTIYRPNGENKHIPNVAECAKKDVEGAQILGIHIEGPFISKERRGMIHPSAVADPSISLFEKILEESQGELRMMTIAPELCGASSIIDRMLANRIIPSFGHSSANYEQALDAFKMGVSHVTHLFNAMQPMHHRSPGPIPAILESTHVTAQIISDGIHIHPAMIRLVANNLNEERCMTITDGVRALGLPDGVYEYDEREFTASGGVARYYDGTLVGTTLGMNELGKRFLNFTGWGLKALVRITSWNPAKLLGLEKSKGTIETGKDGDIVILNNDLSVWMTLVKGRVVYNQSGGR